MTPEQYARYQILMEEWQVLNGYVEDTCGEGGEHAQAVRDLDEWNSANAEELLELERLHETALLEAQRRLEKTLDS